MLILALNPRLSHGCARYKNLPSRTCDDRRSLLSCTLRTGVQSRSRQVPLVSNDPDLRRELPMTGTVRNAEGAAGNCAVKRATAAPPRPFVSQFVYSTFYFTSYAAVFPALFAANIVPGLGAVADGLTDGTCAACN